MDESAWLLYGANGYTGRRIAEEAAARGARPVLAGRNAREIAALAQRLGLPHRVFALDEPRRIAEQLHGVRAVLHCAGPFSATAEPMIEGCLAAQADYLDITGEIAVIEAAAGRHERAVARGVRLLPAVGFDVVPSDCLAAMLARRLPAASRLELAFTVGSRIGPGTAATMVEGLAAGGRTFPFPAGCRRRSACRGATWPRPGTPRASPTSRSMPPHRRARSRRFAGSARCSRCCGCREFAAPWAT